MEEPPPPQPNHRPSVTSTATAATATAESPWASAFQIVCWGNPLYYSTTVGEEVNSIEDNAIGDPSSAPPTITKPLSPSQQKESDEVLGWTLDAAARGVAVMGTAVFVSSELLRLAKEAAGCEQDAANCDHRIYGMRPSSVLTNIVTMVGLVSAVMMPFIGSIIDHTNYRRAVGTGSAAVMSFMVLVQMLVMQDYWFAAAILQVFVAFSYTVHLCAVYAYLPELTNDHEKLVQYTAQFSAAQYSGSVSFLLVMVLVLSTINRNERYNVATLSQTVVVSISILFFGYAWTRLFRPRPASQQVPPGHTLLGAGFWKIYDTTNTILTHHTAIKWFLVSAAFTQAATTAFSTIAITYMTEQLGFTARENGLAILLLLLFGVPGTRLAARLNRTLNPIRSLQLCLVVWILNTSAASIILKGPGQEHWAYLFAMIWGLAIGWVYPTEKTLYVTIIPRGQEAELMGTYICASQMLSWLPPLVFSIGNEMGMSMRLGMFELTIYFVVSLCLLQWVGDYQQAVAHAKAVDEGRQMSMASDGTPNNHGLGMDGYGCYQEWADEDDGVLVDACEGICAMDACGNEEDVLTEGDGTKKQTTPTHQATNSILA